MKKKEDRKHYLYQLICNKTERQFYVGITINTKTRYSQHKRNLNLPKLKGLYKKMKVNNIDDFRLEVIEELPNEWKARLKETITICSLKFNDTFNLNTSLWRKYS